VIPETPRDGDDPIASLSQAVRTRTDGFPNLAVLGAEEAYRKVFADGPVGMAIVGPDMRYTVVNLAFCRMVGYERGELLGRSAWDITHPEEAEQDLALAQTLFEGTITNYQTETRYVTKTGEVVWANVTSFLLRDQDGRPRGAVRVSENVTEPKRTRSALRASENRARRILEQVPVIVYAADPHTAGDWTFVSPQIEALLGYTPEEWMADPKIWFERLHLDDRERVIEEESRSRETGTPFITEYRMHRRDGEVVWIRDEGQMVWDEDQGAVMMQGIMIPITERKRAEEALREGERRVHLLRLAAVAANEASSLPEAAHRVVEEICAHTGWPAGHTYVWNRDRLVSVPEWHLSDPERFAALRSRVNGMVFGSGSGVPERVLRARDPIWVADVAVDPDSPVAREAVAAGLKSAIGFPVLVGEEVVAVLEFFSDGAMNPDVSLVGVMGDIGAQLGRVVERTRAEEALREAVALEREAVERLRRLDEMKSGFLTGVSHELRTPLASVMGYALTLERPDLDLPEEESRDLMHRLAANARKLGRILNDLLDLERLSRGDVVAHVAPEDLQALVSRAMAEVEIPVERTVDVRVDPVVISVEADKVERIVENLVVNALKYSPPEARIWVRSEEEENGVVLVVEDEGPGIPDPLKEAVFEMFQQGPNVPTHSPGVGVGLSLVAQIARLHGGRAWVTDRPGGGSSFRVLFPF
jgi:PAS domain S-box-containing protein